MILGNCLIHDVWKHLSFHKPLVFRITYERFMETLCSKWATKLELFHFLVGFPCFFQFCACDCKQSDDGLAKSFVPWRWETHILSKIASYLDYLCTVHGNSSFKMGLKTRIVPFFCGFPKFLPILHVLFKTIWKWSYEIVSSLTLLLS